MSKSQVFVAKSDKLSNPWYTDSWKEKDSVTTVDKFVIDRVTCKDVTDMRWMFQNCSDLISLDLSNFDTSNVKCMNHMFCNCPYITSLDISSFDTSNVEDMRDMFAHCIRLTTIKGVIDMEYCKYRTHMFYKCPKLTDIIIKNPPLFAQW